MSHRCSMYAVLCILLLGVGLRLHYINRTMRFDEALTIVSFASRNVPSITADYSIPNNHILHTLLVRATLSIGGNHPILLRLPALLAGILTMPIVYRVANCMYGQQTALLATTLVAVSPALVQYSVNARGYSLVTLWTMILLWLAQELKQREHTGRWLLFGMVSALGFYTVPIMLYPMGVVALWLLLSLVKETRGRERRRQLQNFAVALLLGAILTLALYMPVILFSGLDSLVKNSTVQPLPARRFYGEFLTLLIDVLRAVHMDWPEWVIALTLIGSGVAIARHERLSRNRVPLLWPILGWLLPVLALQRVIPFARTWVFLIPMVLTIASAGWISLVRFRRQEQPRAMVALATIGLGIVLGGGLLLSDRVYDSVETGRADDAKAAAFYLNQVMQPNDTFVASWPSNYPIFYYADLYNLDFTRYHATTDSDSWVYIVYHTHEAGELPRLKEGIPELIASAEEVYQLPHSTILRAPYMGPIEVQ